MQTYITHRGVSAISNKKCVYGGKLTPAPCQVVSPLPSFAWCIVMISGPCKKVVRIYYAAFKYTQ